MNGTTRLTPFTALLYKKPHNVFNIKAKPTKLRQKKLSKRDEISVIRKSEYEKDIIIYQTDNGKDCIILLIC